MRMALAPPGADLASPYLCLMPHANATASQVLPAEETEVAIDPVSSWAALSHLDGKCLYTRQGWFTYSCVTLPVHLVAFLSIQRVNLTVQVLP